MPRYKASFRRLEPEDRTVKTRSEESISSLQACFDCTDWGCFYCSFDYINELLYLTQSHHTSNSMWILSSQLKRSHFEWFDFSGNFSILRRSLTPQNNDIVISQCLTTLFKRVNIRRAAIPNAECGHTALVLTGSVRSWQHFLKKKKKMCCQIPTKFFHYNTHPKFKKPQGTNWIQTSCSYVPCGEKLRKSKKKKDSCHLIWWQVRSIKLVKLWWMQNSSS